MSEAARSTRRTAQTAGVSRQRLQIVGAFAVLATLLLVGRLAEVQLVKGAAYAAYMTGEVTKQVAIPAARGAIYDSNGDVLAVSVERTDVIADDFQIGSPRLEARKLSPLLHVPAPRLAAALHQRNGYVVLARGLTDRSVAPIERAGFAGITFASDDVRTTPGGSIFEPLLGAVDAAGKGDAGIEYAENSVLSGKAGSELAAVSPSGVTLPGAPTEVRAARAGTGIVLSVDEPLQVEAEKDLAAQITATGARGGVAVVMNVHTGAILAMVDLVTGAKGTVEPAPDNSAVTSVYQPGSVMKLATIGFALQEGLITPQTVFTVPDSIEVGGYTFSDAELHPTERMTVAQILAQSSNVGTIEIARRLGEQRLAQALSALGFGHPTGLDWPGESAGIVGSPSSWYGSAAASVPIGTGVAVTPLQVLDAYTTIANGGVSVVPHLVDGLVDAAGEEHLVVAARGERKVDASTVRQLVPMLEGVVQDGTAVLAHIPGYTVAGKTGTAQVPNPKGGYIRNDWNSTFVGFVPAEDPQLSAIVVLNHPRPPNIYGGTVSAPVFATIMQYALRHFDIAPPRASTSLAASVSSATKR